jgi:UDP-N-acetylglucosamine 4,6-dehydratase (inverting)
VFNNKSILITGGTGSFGNAFCQRVIDKKYRLKRLIIFSRDEFKQSEMQKKFPESKYNFLRYFIGDIRDKERLNRAMFEVDYVIHAAALKHVNLGEYNPMEVIKTNVIGSQNIVECSLDNKVQNVIALSTDKASSPINLYGASKLCADKIFLAANNYKGKKKIKFSVVRYGNVLGSRGSVLEIFLNNLQYRNFVNITDLNMTRFNITLTEGVDLVEFAFKNNLGGEIFIPKLKSFRVIDLARALNANVKFKVIGSRPGEKIHEELISATDMQYALEAKNYFLVFGNFKKEIFDKYIKIKKLKKVKNFLSYSSNTNKNYLSSKELKIILKENNLLNL